MIDIPPPPTRESWLGELVDGLRPLFWKAGVTLPDKLRVSCGWPSSKGLSSVIGECWFPVTSKDGYHDIFVNPRLDDPIEVGEVLVHELCHTIAGLAAGHKAPFKRLAESVGLEGKMTATVAGVELTQKIALVTSDMIPYPHGAITPPTKIGKQGTRMLKVVCPDCDYTVRTTAKWLQVGVPVCPCGTEMIADNPEGEGE
jgi:hypothetical protein